MRIIGHILPIIQYLASDMNLRTTKAAAIDLVAMAVGQEATGKRGYFMGQKQVTSSEDSHDEGLRERMWKACEKWAKVNQAETTLNLEKGGY
jgi:hypothetical protein